MDQKRHIEHVQTERLYYVDPYMRDFRARVVGRRAIDGREALALDRTAFYPTGGGQPYDSGTLDGCGVVDVIADAGLVWHVLAACSQDVPAVGAELTGSLDWARRLDHMQQHTGQHVLSEAFIKTCHAQTVAFHMGTTECTIDLDRNDLDGALLASVEAAANDVVDLSLPVMARFVDAAELSRLPLRKAPTVEGPVRIVEVAGYDWSACGGTHLANTSQIGLIKIVGTERRGNELRVAFLCGRRARLDYARVQKLAEGLAVRFSMAQDEVPAAVERLADEARSVRKDLQGLEAEWADARALALWSAVPPQDGRRVIVQPVDYSVERTKRVAQALRALPGTVVLLGVRGERPQLIFTRSDDVAVDMGSLLKHAAAAGGGRGGGRPDWAQGGVPSVDALGAALNAAVAALALP